MHQTVYIGTYTYSGGKGVYRASLSESGKLSLINFAENTSPSYLIFSSDKKYLYAANEAREVEGIPGGAVTAFRVLGDGSLEKVVIRATGGGSPCHLLEHNDYLYAANYGEGNVAVFPLVEGIPGEAEFIHQHEGSGPDKGRQEGPHAHCIMAAPGSDEFCVIDLGIDQARFYRKDSKALTLTQSLPFPGGSGPRHMVFSHDGRFAWVVTELSNEIYCIANQLSDSSEWAIIAKYPTLPPDYTGRSACAAIRLSPDGSMIAASNRFHDSIAVFNVDAATGLLTLKGIYPCCGATPRDIDFSPDGKWLLSANQDSDIVTVLSVEDKFSIVEDGSLNIPKPTCVLF